MKPYGSKVVSECVNRVANGETIADVSRDTGVSQSAIGNWCREAGVASQCTYRHFTDDEAERFSEMWADGATYEEVAAELGRTPAALSTYARKHRDKFPSRKRGGIRYTKARVEALETEIERLRGLLRDAGIEDDDAT